MDFSIKNALSVGWAKFLDNAGFLIGISFVYFFIGLALAFIASTMQNNDHTLLGALVHIAAFLLGLLMMIGVIKIILSLIDGRTAEFGELFRNWSLLWPYFAGYVLFGLIVFGGLILLIVPGIIWGIQFSFYLYYVVDKGLGPIEALKASSALTRGIKWQLFGFYLLLILINFAGFLLLGVGALVSYPVTFLAHAYVFRRLSAGAVSI